MTKYRKSWTEVIEEVILNEALKPLDKSVIDAFYYKKEKAGKVVSTDGDSLWKNGLGGQEIALWVGRKIHISAVSDVKSTEAILKYMKKSIPSGVFEEVEATRMPMEAPVVLIGEKWEVGVVYHQDFGGGEISYFRADSLLKNKRWKGMSVDEYSGKQKKPRNITADEKTPGWEITPKDKIPKGLKEEVDIDEAVNLKKLKKEYEDNEDKNNHTENYLLLAKAFGSSSDVKKVQEIMKRNAKEGSTSKADNDWMYKNINPYYDKIRNEEVEVEEDAKMGKQSDDQLRKIYKKAAAEDQSSPANKSFTKRIEKEMKKRGIREEVVVEGETYLKGKAATGYDLYHKDFSSAMQHAYDHAKKKGFVVDPKEIDDKVATGPKKPSSGKSNRYALKAGRKTVHIQVANLDNKRYELNMYIEDYDKNQLLRVKHDEALIAEAGDICALNRGVLRSKSMQAVWEKKCAPKLDNQTLGEVKMKTEKLVDTVRKVIMGMGEEEKELSDKQKAYRKFFDKALKKFDIKSPADLKGDEEKKKFYDYIDKNWKGEHEEQKEGVEKLSDKDLKSAMKYASTQKETDNVCAEMGKRRLKMEKKKITNEAKTKKEFHSLLPHIKTPVPSGDEDEETVPESTGLQLKMAFDDAGIKVKGTKGGKLVIAKKDEKKVIDVLSKSLKKGSDAKKVVDSQIKFEDVEKPISKLFSHVRKLMSK